MDEVDLSEIELIGRVAALAKRRAPSPAKLCAKYGGVAGLMSAPARDLPPALRPVIDTIHQAALRALRAEVSTSAPTNFGALVDLARMRLARARREKMLLISLNFEHHILNDSIMAVGTVDRVSVWPRDIVHQALTDNAITVVLAHNHLSGDATPSSKDLELTEYVADALSRVEVELYDHLIVAPGTWTSMLERGDLKRPGPAIGSRLSR